MIVPSHAWAIVWSMWVKHRWLFLTTAGYLLISAVAVRIVPVRESPVVVRMLVVPSVALFGLIMTVFMMSEPGPKSNPRHEGFPARLFTLPVRTADLVGWSMFSGIATVVLLWFALVGFVLHPCGLDFPFFVPALGLATMLAFIQAIAWAPFGPMLIRAPVVIVLAPTLIATPIWAVEIHGVSPILYWVLGPCYLAASYAMAVWGVARERRGDSNTNLPRVLDWLADRIRGGSQPFRSADRAQLWFEWRGAGYVYPSFVALVLLPCLVVSAAMGNPDAAAASLSLALVVFLMIFLSMLIGGGFAKTHFQAGGTGLSPFTMARPMSSGGLVAAKLKTAALSALAGWIVAALIVLPCLALLGYTGPVATLWAQFLPGQPLLKTLVVVPLAGVALLLMTWKALVGGLTVGLTGRSWIGIANLLVTYFVVGGTLLLARWLYTDPELRARFLQALPWLLGMAVTLKGLAAFWVLRAASRRGHISTATLRAGLVLWLTIAAGLFVLAWVLLPGANKSVALVLCGVLLLIPLVRLAAAPLALDMQRHH